jgi:hypothetical protein
MSSLPLAEIVEWEPLLEAILVSTVFGLAVLAFGAFAVFSSLRAQDQRSEGHGGAVLAYSAATVLCVALLLAAIATGIWAMTQ